MSEIGEMFQELKERSQDKRAGNRENSAAYLNGAAIPFTTHNNGAHLVVEGDTCYIDFWPGTGKWITRDEPKKTGFGVRNLVNFIKGL